MTTTGSRRLRIGVDFDNTIVCYDRVFHEAAVAMGLVPRDVPVSKDAVRNWLRAQGQEDAWTELQGHVYGPGMRRAAPFPGAVEFLRRCAKAGHETWVISHRTRHPFLGPPHDLHAAAREWLAGQGFHDPALPVVPQERVCLELTKQDKLRRIAAVGCTHFIDDLPEFLAEAGFPEGVVRILFDPSDQYRAETRFRRATAWADVWELLGL